MNSIMYEQGCVSCSRRQFHIKNYSNQDSNAMICTDTNKRTQRYQTKNSRYHYSWRTFINLISSTYLNSVLSFLMLLSRLLYNFNKRGYKRTFVQSILFLFGLTLLANTSLCQHLSQQETKLMDAIVPIGTHFMYKIPSSQFDCDVHRLEVSEGSTRSLPKWLAYSQVKQELYGVASLKDVGTYEILVVAITNSSTGTGRICGIRAFSIKVLASDSSSEVKPVLSSVTVKTPLQADHGDFQCSPGTQAIIATVLFSGDIHEMTGHERMVTLTSMADHLNVPSSKVAIFSADNGHPLLSDLQQLSVLSSGAGDARFKPGSKSLLTWMLSCGAIRLSDSYLTELESKAKDGTLTEVLGHPIVGWHVTSGVQKSRHRARRAAAATPTPIATSVAPTRVISSSTITINATSSLLISSFVMNNSTVLPLTTVYSSPSSSVILSSTVEYSLNVSSEFRATSSVSNMSSLPVLSSLTTTVATPMPSTVTVNLSSQINSTVPIRPSSSIESSFTGMNETSYIIVPSTTPYINASATSILSNSTLVQFNFSTVGSSFSMNSTMYITPSPSATLQVNASATSVLSNSTLVQLNASTVGSSFSMNSTMYITPSPSVTLQINASATSVLSNSTLVQFNSSTVSSSFSKNSTMYITPSPTATLQINASATSVLSNSTLVQLNSSTVGSSFSLNSTMYITPSPSMPQMNASATSVLLNSTLIQLNSSTVSSSIYTNSTMYITPSPSTSFTENSTALNSTSVFQSMVSILPNTTSYLPSSFVNSSLFVSSVSLNETTSVGINSTISDIVSSTHSINMTSSIHPSFQTSSVVLPSSTLSPSVTQNMTSNMTLSSSSVFLDRTSSISASSVNVTSATMASNTSGSISLLPSISTVPLVTTVNISSVITPTVMNTSLVDGSSLDSTVPLATSAVISSSPVVSSSVVIPTTKPNSPPQLKNDIGRIQTTAGKAFRYLVPEDTFHDNEDGNTRQLNLTMKYVVEGTAQEIPPDFWLTFDSATQVIAGLPMDKDIPDPQNLETGVKFLLTAKDSHGAVAYDVFEILIGPSSSTPYTQSLTVTISNDFEVFNSNLTQRLNLLGKISSYYKDPDTSQIIVTSYKKGSVVVTWTNDSLPSNECDQEKLNVVAEKVVDKNGPKTEFKEHLSPEYIVTSAQRTLGGVCVQNATTSAPLITDKNIGTEPLDLWEKHVIPGIIVVIILIILAILLLCFIRRRRAKPSDPERRTYTKRKPIILDPEMEMKPIPSKPLILDNDSPLSHPPSYASDPSLYRSSPYYDNGSGDFDEEDNTPPKQSPVYETPPPSYMQPEEPEEPPPPPYMLPPTLLYPKYDFAPWEESSDV